MSVRPRWWLLVYGLLMPLGLVLIVAAIGLLAMVARGLGLRVWTPTDTASLAAAVQWHHVVPIAVLVGLAMFREPLSDLIRRIKRVGSEKVGVDTHDPGQQAQAQQQAVVSGGREDLLITTGDVLERFRPIRLIYPGSFDGDTVALAQTYLLRNGVATRSRLAEFARAGWLHEKLADVYRDVYPWRPSETPLDPVALATWGPGYSSTVRWGTSSTGS